MLAAPSLWWAAESGTASPRRLEGVLPSTRHVDPLPAPLAPIAGAVPPAADLDRDSGRADDSAVDVDAVVSRVRPCHERANDGWGRARVRGGHGKGLLCRGKACSPIVDRDRARHGAPMQRPDQQERPEQEGCEGQYGTGAAPPWGARSCARDGLPHDGLHRRAAGYRARARPRRILGWRRLSHPRQRHVSRIGHGRHALLHVRRGLRHSQPLHQPGELETGTLAVDRFRKTFANLRRADDAPIWMNVEPDAQRAANLRRDAGAQFLDRSELGAAIA